MRSQLKNKGPILLLFFVAILMQKQPANADAGWITAGGTAHLIEDKAGTVSMQSEIVKIRVGKHMVRADCTFVFVNNGPSCSVRMGFPDQASMPMHDPRKHIRGSFLSFSAFVNGKRIKSEVVEDNKVEDGFGVWHASKVDFGENETVLVRNTYKVRPGILPISENSTAKSVAYILETASSWGSPVKKGDIFVTFNKLATPKSLNVDLNTSFNDMVPAWSQDSPQNVVWSGTNNPTLEGRTLHFSFSDLSPTKEDDILILYDRMNFLQTVGYSGISMGSQFLFENMPSHLRRRVTRTNQRSEGGK